MEWYRNDKAAVTEALRRGERPDLATTMASGPLDELVALHQDLGIFAILDELEVQRVRAGVPDELLLRTLATLPLVEPASLSGGSEALFPEPAILLQRGWAPAPIRAGSNGRHRHPEGRQEESLPCHPATDAAMRCGASGRQRGCRRTRPGCGRSRSGSWCGARSLLSMVVAWAMTFVWSPWGVCQPAVPSSWPGDS